MLLTLLPLALAACAATMPPANEVPVAAVDKDTVCEREARTGTSLPTTRCRTAAEREAARQGIDSIAEGARNIRAGQTGKPGS